MRRNSLVHVSKHNFNEGDKDIIRLYFDTNPATKRKKLDSFYSKSGTIEKNYLIIPQ